MLRARPWSTVRRGDGTRRRMPTSLEAFSLRYPPHVPPVPCGSTSTSPRRARDARAAARRSGRRMLRRQKSPVRGARHGTRSGHALRSLLREAGRPRPIRIESGPGARNGREGARSERKRFPKAKVDREGTVQLQAALYIVRIPSATRHANHHVTPMRSASIAPTVIGCSRFQCVLTISATACLVARFARERPNLGGRRPPRVASAGNIVCARAHHAAAPASCA
jgi:hypothetical protein